MIKEINLCECGCGQKVKSGNRFIHNHHGCKTPWKPKPEPKLCECGCGEYANPGNRFIWGHQNRGKPYRKSQQESQLCECGCGNYAKSGDRFINGHQSIGRKHSDEMIKKLRDAAIKRWGDPKEREKARDVQLKRFEDPKEYEKAKERAIENWNNPTHRENAKDAAIKRFEDPLEREKMRDAANKRWEDPIEHEKHSAAKQGISYDEWEDFASNSLYCPDFNEKCKESNRKKYDRKCFLTGLPEEENIGKTGKQRNLSVHHVDMDKGQGCDGKKWKLVPVCMVWHSKVHNELWKTRIIWLLDNVWNNKDYKY